MAKISWIQENWYLYGYINLRAHITFFYCIVQTWCLFRSGVSKISQRYCSVLTHHTLNNLVYARMLCEHAK